MSREEAILQQIEEVKSDLTLSKSRIASLRKQLNDVETDHIGLQLKLEMLQEELRVFRNRKVDNSPDDRDIEIKEFKQRLPLLISRLNKND